MRGMYLIWRIWTRMWSVSMRWRERSPAVCYWKMNKILPAGEKRSAQRFSFCVEGVAAVLSLINI
jgi:hypothetical protein